MLERIGWGPGGCKFLGFQFSEQFVRAIDVTLVLYFFLMVSVWMSDYDTYLKNEKCTKPFGALWIGHVTCIIIFRVLHYLWRYFSWNMAMGVFEDENTEVRRGQFWVKTMLVGKLFVFWSFLILTVIFSTWFFEEGECVNRSNCTFNEEIKMGCWLLASAAFCLAYTWRILRMQIFEGVSPALTDDDGNELLWADQAGHSRSRSLTERQLKGIKKFNLFSFDEVSSFATAPMKPLQQMSIEMNKVTTNESALEKEESSAQADVESKEDEDDLLKDNCAVCQEEMEIGRWYKRLPLCKHFFHASCIDRWLSTRAACPVCRNEVYIDENTLEPLVADRGYLQEQIALHEVVLGEVVIGSNNSDSESHSLGAQEVS